MKHFNFSPNPLALAACLALLAAPMQVFAQETTPKADADKLETVVVKGVRQAIKSAEDTKRTADQVVEAINAEDIGKFPDKSVGEALQRLPGVQVGRNAGEVNEVLIRGLPDVATTFNGHEIFTGNGRRLAYQDLPVEAVQSLQIYKSATADQNEGGIAGLMNVRSRRPFDFAGDTLSVYGSMRQTDVKGNQASSFSDPVVGGLVSKRVKTDLGEMGILFDAVYIKDRYQAITQWVDVQDRLWAVKPDGTGTRLDDGQSAPAGTVLASLPHVGGVYAAGERKRPMAHLALQWKPSSELELNAQALHMGYKARTEDDFAFAIVGWAPNATGIKVDTQNGCLPSPRGTVCPVISANVPAVSDPNNGAYTVDPYTATSTQAREQKTNTDFFSVGANWKRGPLRLDSDLAYSRSKFIEDRIIVDQAILSPSVNIFTYDDGGHGGFTVTNPGSTAPLKDPQQFRLRAYYQSWFESSGQQVQWRNDATYKLSNDGFLREVMGGLRLSSREAEYHGAEQGQDVPNLPSGRNIDRPIPAVALGAGSQALVPGIDRLGGSFITPDRDYLLNNRDAIRTFYGLATGRQIEDKLRQFDQTERSVTLYGSGRFATEIGGVEISGVAGVRVINTKRNQKGNSNFGGVLTPFDTDTSDTDVLPSLNTKFVWGDNWQSRLAIGKTISRPDFASLNPSLNLTPPAPPNRPTGSGSGGNPDLKPVESTSIDLTTEYYFDKNGLAALALFHRKIDGYIYGLSNRETINGLQYDISRPFNSGKGTLRGYELTVQKFLDMLPGWLSGFGVAANYTHIDGNTRVSTDLAQTSFSERPLFGVAKDNINASLLYDRDGFNARLTLNRRDRYLEGIVGPFAHNQWVKPTTFVDLGIGYQITPQLTVQLDAGNLTNAKYESYMESENRPRDVRYWNRTYALSLRFKL